MADRIELGDRVKDRITGLTGIAIARTEWLYGCVRYSVQPEETKDGKPADCYVVDAHQLEVVQKTDIAKPPPRHGDRQNVAVRASAPAR